MKRVVLISCSARKRGYATKARELYDSDLFKKSLKYAEQLEPDAIFILSAKYGLVPLNEVIKPYNMTLNNMKAAEIRQWAERVRGQLTSVSNLEEDHFVFLWLKRVKQQPIA
jgi:cytoplasmic iron level regulating protein YaaA (DUF328/UPF0246 family)